MIRLFRFMIIQHLPDMSLIRIDHDVVATPHDDTIHNSSTLREVRIFTCHLFLHLVCS